MTNICLILLAHGSPDPRWRAPFQTLAEAVGREQGGSRVKLAYMEFSPPTLADAARQARQEGFTVLRLLPLFMAAGAHVERDIPAQADTLRRNFPELTVEILPVVGEHPRVRAALQEISRESLL
jgi:sirohydrochlorin cobaltochelatase